MSEKLIVYDTDCLSCFITINDTSVLEELYETIIIPQMVYNEFNRRNTQYLKKRVDKLIEKGFIIKLDIKPNSKEDYTYKSLKNGDITGKDLGRGESAALTFAIHNNYIIASNNTSDVIEVVEKFELDWIRTGDILIKALKKGIITEDEGNKLWVKMLKAGRYLNPQTFTAYIKQNK